MAIQKYVSLIKLYRLIDFIKDKELFSYRGTKYRLSVSRYDFHYLVKLLTNGRFIIPQGDVFNRHYIINPKKKADLLNFFNYLNDMLIER